MKKIRFRHWLCFVKLLYYNNGRVAIQLIDVEDGSPVAVATVNLPQYDLSEDEVIIKDYSENEGVLAALIKGGVITKPVRYVLTGFVTCPVCKLLIKN
jgi:hypothetical protein